MLVKTIYPLGLALMFLTTPARAEGFSVTSYATAYYSDGQGAEADAVAEAEAQAIAKANNTCTAFLAGSKAQQRSSWNVINRAWGTFHQVYVESGFSCSAQSSSLKILRVAAPSATFSGILQDNSKRNCHQECSARSDEHMCGGGHFGVCCYQVCD